MHYESFRIFDRVDSAKRFQLALAPSFPLAVRLYEFPAGPRAVPMTWHERLEIFCPLSGSGAFRIGEHLERFEATDILLIDNLKLHGVDHFDGDRRHALVVVFHPELLAAPGGLPCDMWLLRPFRHLREGTLRLPAQSSHSAKAWDCLNRIVVASDEVGDPAHQIRQKLALADLLLVLGEAFRDRVSENSDYDNRRDRLQRLSPLLDFVATNLADPLTVPAAAGMLNMTTSYFMRFFRAATGMTFSAYGEQLRVSKAYQLLIKNDCSLAQIAAETGFCDQCHLSRHIRRRFGTSPGRIRSQQHPSGSKPAGTLPG